MNSTISALVTSYFAVVTSYFVYFVLRILRPGHMGRVNSSGL